VNELTVHLSSFHFVRFVPAFTHLTICVLAYNTYLFTISVASCQAEASRGATLLNFSLSKKYVLVGKFYSRKYLYSFINVTRQNAQTYVTYGNVNELYELKKFIGLCTQHIKHEA